MGKRKRDDMADLEAQLPEEPVRNLLRNLLRWLHCSMLFVFTMNLQQMPPAIALSQLHQKAHNRENECSAS